jgi:hypothetical protein
MRIKQPLILLPIILLSSFIFSLNLLNKVKQIINFLEIYPISFINDLDFLSGLLAFVQILHDLLHLADLIIDQLLSLL